MSVQQEKIKAIIHKIWSFVPNPQPMSGDNIVNAIDDVYAAGIKAGKGVQYDVFWDSHQSNGNRKDYGSAFYEWKTEMFEPKYDIAPTGRASNIFYNAYIEGDLRDILSNLGRKLDFSKCINISYGFKYSNFTGLPVLDLSSVTEKSYHLCQYCDKLKIIDKIVITYGNQTNILLNHAFDGCTELTDIIIEMTDKTDDNGIIQDIGFPDSHVLSKNSIKNIISLIHPLRRITVTFSERAVIKAFGSVDDAEWLSLVGNVPNATIALV